MINLAFAREPPQWSGNYFVKGILYFSNGQIEEPFVAWYDAENGRSRIDYYDGTVSTYQISQESDYGKMYRIIPVTTFEETNKRTCYELEANKQNDDGNVESQDSSDNNENNETNDSSENTESNEINNKDSMNDEAMFDSTTEYSEVNMDVNDTSTDFSTTTEYDEYEGIFEDRKRRSLRGDDETTNNDHRIKPQSVLPNCNDFKYAGEKFFRFLFLTISTQPSQNLNV